MNRLILLGNGFDLAHGLKTGYNDFIKNYFKNCLECASVVRPYEDTMIRVEKVEYYFGTSYDNELEDYIGLLYETNLAACENDYLKMNGQQNDFPNPFKVKIKSPLLKQLLTKCSYNSWVDVENDFYDMLKGILRMKDGKQEALRNLNGSLAFLISELEEFLLLQKPSHLDARYSGIFNSEILQEDLVASIVTAAPPQRTMVLNFNYTSTVEEYFKPSHYNRDTIPYEVNYIHGRLETTSNPIIFGFGDELDEDYSAMEFEKTKGFLKFIKSFWYFKTTNYHNLLRFIESDKYQIFILGHSCGLSDRTMLNMLFEHRNCESLKIFYYDNGNGYDNHEDLTYEISKHFKDKSRMRRVIVPKSRSMPMPQVQMPG